MRKWNFSKIGTYAFGCSLTLILWLGLMAFFLDFGAIGTRESIDFVWQMISLSFLLATLVYSVNPKSVEPRQRKRLPQVGVLFIMSGVLVISGYGLMKVGIKAEPSIAKEILMLMAQFFFHGGTLCLAGGIATMTLRFLGED